MYIILFKFDTASVSVSDEMMNHTVQHVAEWRVFSLRLRCQKKQKRFSHRWCSELWDTSMTISGTMPACACDVSWCVCTSTYTCMCKLHQILIGVRTCHSVHMKHAYAHVHTGIIHPHICRQKYAELGVSSQSLPPAACACVWRETFATDFNRDY